MQAGLRRNTKGAADVMRQLRLVERVKVQMIDAALQQVVAQLCRQRGCQQIGVAVAQGIFKGLRDNWRDAGARCGGEFRCALPVLDGQDAGDDWGVDAGLHAFVAETEKVSASKNW